MSSKSTANSVFFRYSPSDSSITRKNFEAFFSDIGPVKKCSLIRQDKTEANEKRRDAKGYGFCKFTCQEDANEAAEKLNEKTMELEYGMKVKVWVEVADKEAASKEKKPAAKLPEGTPDADSKSIPTDELLLIQSKKRTSRVIIRNLSFYATENNIRQVMQERFGEVIEINLPLIPIQSSQGKKKQQHRGFAFVTFANQNAANKAVDVCASDEKVLIKNRPVAIDFSVSKAHHQRLQDDQKNDAQMSAQNKSESGDDSEDSEENIDDVDDNGSDSEEDTASESDSDSKSENDSDEDMEEEEEEEEDKPNDESEYKRSLFLRNLPFDATRHDLFQLFKQFGHVEAVFLVKDRETGINKGTAFVKFSKEGGCVRALDACNSNIDGGDIFKSSKKLMTEGESTGGGIYLNGRRILVDLAVDKGTADTLKVERDENGKPVEKIGKDRRNLYLKGEGRVESSQDKDDPNSWENIPESDQLKRGRAHQDKATKLRSPLFFINPLRVSVRNLAKHVDEKGLKELMVKGLKNGLQNKLVSKEDVIAHYRAMGEMTKREIIEKITKAEGDGTLIPQFDEKSIKSFIPSVFIDRDFTNFKDTGSSKGSKLVAPSRGFGFVEFTHHIHALACLRELNNNTSYSAEYVAGGKRAIDMKKNSKKRKKPKAVVTDMEDGASGGDFVGEDGRVRIPRLIIEFTVENKAKARKQAERKAQQAANIQKQKEVSKESKKEDIKEKKKTKSRGALQREKKRKAKEAGIEEDEKDIVNEKKPKKQETNTLADEPKNKVKGLKPPKKIKKTDKEDSVFEEMVQSYKRTFAADVDDIAPEKVINNPRVEVAKKRWFD
jgi:nucleolar protein 4